MVPVCVILSPGVWSSISAPGWVGLALTFGLVLDLVLRNDRDARASLVDLGWVLVVVRKLSFVFPKI